MKFYINKIATVAIVLIIFLVSNLLAAAERKPKETQNGKNTAASTIRTETLDEVVMPGLFVNPGAMDFGVIGQDSVLNGLLTFKNMTGGSVPWFIDFPEGWDPGESKGMAGELRTDLNYLHFSLKSDKGQLKENADRTKSKYYNVKLKIEMGDQIAIIQKELPEGDYHEPLSMILPGGAMMLNIGFFLMDLASMPALSVDPPHLDFGILAPGKQMARQVKITNKARETAKWRFITSAYTDPEGYELPPLKGKHVSFMNEGSKTGAAYLITSHLKEGMELSGKWVAQEGYPSALGPNNYIRYRFFGTGIAVFLWHGPEEGRLAAYLDDQLVYVYDGKALERGREELPIADGLSNGPHVLTLVNGEGRTIVEGVNIYGKEIKRGAPGWVRVLPPSGSTTREADYATVQIDTQNLTAGFYGEQIILSSLQGDVILDAQVEIRPDQGQKSIDVYRFVKEHTYFYTINPQAEAERLTRGRYIKEGIAYRLFAPGVPGTTKFYRWFNVKKQDFFYSYDLNGGGKSLLGYTLEGNIGNIATSKLSNTRELYRWYNQDKGSHFFTTDPGGEGMANKGYKFDGIAGYVR